MARTLQGSTHKLRLAGLLYNGLNSPQGHFTRVRRGFHRAPRRARGEAPAVRFPAGHSESFMSKLYPSKPRIGCILPYTLGRPWV